MSTSRGNGTHVSVLTAHAFVHITCREGVQGDISSGLLVCMTHVQDLWRVCSLLPVPCQL
jgi:hypothetical protein